MGLPCPIFLLSSVAHDPTYTTKLEVEELAYAMPTSTRTPKSQGVQQRAVTVLRIPSNTIGGERNSRRNESDGEVPEQTRKAAPIQEPLM